VADVTRIFGGAFSPRAPKPIDEQIREAMLAAGISPPVVIEIDGKMHRWQTGSKGKPGHDKPGWYVFFPDGVPAGMYGDWRTGVSHMWRADMGRDLSSVELASVSLRQAEARAARDAKAASAADSVELIWSQAGAASPDHPYLVRKNVGAHGLRITGDGRLMAPLFSPDGALSSLQYIDSEGGKLYHPGGATGGRYWSVGALEGDLIYVAEGFATAATIHEATGKPCVVAYSASNLVPVTGSVSEAYPNARLVIVADNDASGVGQRYGEQASARHGARLIVVPHLGDANDYVAAGHDLLSLLNPPVEQWLIPADDFSSQPAPIQWLVKGWLQSDALHMIHGPSGGGKTFAVLDMVLHMAAGKEAWNGIKMRPGSVVYLAGEGHHGLRGRVAAWKQHHQASRLAMWLSREGCDLNTVAGLLHVMSHIRDLKVMPAVIVIDTLHRFLRGDENSAVDAKTMLDACATLMREFNCAVILVHHTGVSDEAQHRARGSSAWRGALDIEISVVPSEGSMRLVQRKSKDAELQPDIAARLLPVAIHGWLDDDGEPVTSAVLDVTSTQEASQKQDRKPNTSRMEIHQKIVTQAWLGITERRDGKPYLGRETLRQHLHTCGFTAGTIRNMMSPATANKMINVLTVAGFIRSEDEGWLIVEPSWVAQLNLLRPSPVSPGVTQCHPGDSGD